MLHLPLPSSVGLLLLELSTVSPWAKCLAVGKEEGPELGWNLRPAHNGSLLTGGLPPGASLSSSLSLSCIICEVGTAHGACWEPMGLQQANGSRRPGSGRCEHHPPPPLAEPHGSHLAGILLALVVASTQHTGCHLIVISLTAQVLRDQLHVHLLQTIAGGTCRVGSKAEGRGEKI